MNTITEKQIKFIASLTAQTGAYQDGEGMAVAGKIYPRLDLDAALDGQTTKREASQIISILLDAPKRRRATASSLTPKQYSYIKALLKDSDRKFRDADLLEMTCKEASTLIDELLAEKAAA